VNNSDQKPVQSLTALVSASMQVTAKLAQTVAEAATGESQEKQTGETSLQEIIRYGSTAAGGILALSFSALKQGMGAREPKEGPIGQPPLPTVISGQEIRIPLSIDNPNLDEVMELQPTLVSLKGSGSSETYKPKISFEPDTLSIAAHDFEKLVVIVKTDKRAKAGQWVCAFNFGDAQSGENEFRFEVIAQEV